jgi:hypothetical protein
MLAARNATKYGLIRVLTTFSEVHLIVSMITKSCGVFYISEFMFVLEGDSCLPPRAPSAAELVAPSWHTITHTRAEEKFYLRCEETWIIDITKPRIHASATSLVKLTPIHTYTHLFKCTQTRIARNVETRIATCHSPTNPCGYQRSDKRHTFFWRVWLYGEKNR